MPALVIKNLPAEIHRRLKEDAEQHHRSMTKHVVAILEETLGGGNNRSYPPPVKVAFPMTDKFLDKAKRWGR